MGVKPEYSYFNQGTRNLPRKPRECTDICCAILFILVTLAGIGTGAYGLMNGDLKRIGQPYDTDGNACGVGNVAEYGYLFFNEPKNTDLTKANICVKACPKTSTDVIDCFPNSNFGSCTELTAYESSPLGKRFCWPIDNGKDTEDADANENFDDLGKETIYGDLVDAWPIYLISIGVTFLLALAFLKALEACALSMIKFMIAIYAAVMFVLGAALFYNYITIMNRTDIHEDEKNGYLFSSLIVWGLLLVFLCMIWCSWKRVKLAATILQATADYLTDVKRVMFVPILLFIIFVSFLGWWMYSGAYLFSSGEVTHDPTQPFGKIKRTELVDNLWIFHQVYLLWTTFFINHLGHFVLSTVACIWYFAPNRKKLDSPIYTSFSWGLFYHIGTVAFGSFVLAVVWIIKQIIEYMKQAAEQERRSTGNSNGQLMIACLSCCANCFNELLKYLSRHAYIETALHNTNFCKGCYESAAIIMSNLWKIGVLHGIANLAIMFGTLTIAAFVTLIGYLLMKSYQTFGGVVFETLYPLIIVFLIGLYIASFFMHTFDISADTLIHCYIVDEKSNNGIQHQFSPLNNALNGIPATYGAQGGYQDFHNNSGYEMGSNNYAQPMNNGYNNNAGYYNNGNNGGGYDYNNYQ